MKRILANIFLYGPYFIGWKNTTKRFWTSLILIIAFLISSTQIEVVYNYFMSGSQARTVFKFFFGILTFFFIRDSIIAGVKQFASDINNMSDEQLDKAMKSPFKINKTCPYCLKRLPSAFVKKCPHCTSDL